MNIRRVYQPERSNCSGRPIAIVQRHGQLDIPDNKVESQNVWAADDDFELEDAVLAAQNAQIMIMNPPFTNRTKMGEKFPKRTQKALRARTRCYGCVTWSLGMSLEMEDFVDKNSLRPLLLSHWLIVVSTPLSGLMTHGVADASVCRARLV